MRRYVYVWADGVYFSPRLEHKRRCFLVLIGADASGKKELLAIDDGFRESEQSWHAERERAFRVVRLRDENGLTIDPELATGDGADANCETGVVCDVFCVVRDFKADPLRLGALRLSHHEQLGLLTEQDRCLTKLSRLDKLIEHVRGFPKELCIRPGLEVLDAPPLCGAVLKDELARFRETCRRLKRPRPYWPCSPPVGILPGTLEA